MSLKAKIYLSIIYLTGLSLVLLAWINIEKSLLLFVFLWILIALPFEIKPIHLADNVKFALSFAIHIALIIIYGFWFAIIVAAAITAIADLVEKRGPVKLLFNVNQFVISIYIAGVLFYYFKRSADAFALPYDIFAFVAASITYALFNMVLVATVVALSERISLLHELKRDLKMVVLYYTALAPLSMLMVILYNVNPLTMLLIVPTFVFVHISYNNYALLKTETRKTLESLADFVDRRDHSTAEHSKRVAIFSRAIAEELSIDDEVKELIELAGRVHDLGKISVSDNILFKPDVLTAEEMKIINLHPDVAYNILKSLQMYATGSVIVREHHERFDGRGYPRGLKCNDIHIGARIIAVADAFDAMTSDRPYRKAMGADEAVRELEENSGAQFDPEVVQAFLSALRQKKIQLEVK